MRTETFDNPAEFLAAVQGKPRTTRGRSTRPDLPSAGRSPRTGLSTFLKAGWCWTYVVGRGFKLEKGALSSGWQVSEQAACDAARGLL